MRWAAIFSFSLLILLIFTSGCTLDNAWVKSKDTARVKNEDPTVQSTNKVLQSENGVPLLIAIPKYNDAKTKIVEERALLGHWDVRTGNISLGDKYLPKDKLANDPGFDPKFRVDGDSGSMKNEDGTISAFVDLTSEQGAIVIVRQIDKGITEKMMLKPPLPDEAGGPMLLLISGKPDDFVLLATYDGPSKTGDGGLLLYSYNGSHERWREVKGSSSLIAAYSPDAIKINGRIYIDDKSGFTTKQIDLEQKPLKLVDYAPANELISQVKDAIDAPETPPLGFGSYQDILLVQAGGNTRWWIWAIQNDTCIGKIYVNTEEKRIVTYKGDKIVDEKHLPEAPDGIWLPRI